ncbi:MAG: hypothetical protein HRT37_02970 [Alteromonadaceae bacterium]|nr:hypothetical protein [Alteromonadaceae bacterium]
MLKKDDVHPDVFTMAQHINEGLLLALDTLKKIEISEYFERMYVTIKLPIPSHSDRYTAEKI